MDGLRGADKPYMRRNKILLTGSTLIDRNDKRGMKNRSKEIEKRRICVE